MREIHACECHYADGRYRTTPIKRVKRVLFFGSFACVAAFCCALHSPWRFGGDPVINCWRFIKITRDKERNIQKELKLFAKSSFLEQIHLDRKIYSLPKIERKN